MQFLSINLYYRNLHFNTVAIKENANDSLDIPFVAISFI